MGRNCQTRSVQQPSFLLSEVYRRFHKNMSVILFLILLNFDQTITRNVNPRVTKLFTVTN